MSFRTGPRDEGLGAIVPKRTSFATTGARALTGALLLLTAGLGTACSDDDDDDGESQGKIAEALRFWNQVTVDASGLDHMDPMTASCLGPGRASRAMAIAHIAIFEAMNAAEGGPWIRRPTRSRCARPSPRPRTTRRWRCIPTRRRR
jgi:hypothetical protein